MIRMFKVEQKDEIKSQMLNIFVFYQTLKSLSLISAGSLILRPLKNLDLFTDHNQRQYNNGPFFINQWSGTEWKVFVT